MVGIADGSLTGIIEDGNLPGDIFLIGELQERESGSQIACALPLNGEAYGAIAQRTGAEPGFEGKYEGLFFRVDAASEKTREFKVAGKIQFSLKATDN